MWRDFKSEAQGFLDNAIPALNRQNHERWRHIVHLEWRWAANFQENGVIVAAHKTHGDE